MKSLLSLFDYSCNWPRPFYNNGWDVVPWDIKIDEFRDIMKLDGPETLFSLFENEFDGILAAIPCTDFAVCGSQYWKAKDLDGRTLASMDLVYQVEKLVDWYFPTDPDYFEEGGTFFWSIENPVGRLGKLHPELQGPIYWHPYEFAGYLNLSNSDHNELDRIRRKDGIGITREEIDFVLRCEAYTKKTGLWGDFNRNLVKKPVEPVRVCRQGSPIQTFGGKSDKTKEARSLTPTGFAQAFYEANKEYQPQYDYSLI
jgi:hypothetical protein